MRGTWNIGPISGESIGICLIEAAVNSKVSNPLEAQGRAEEIAQSLRALPVLPEYLGLNS